MSESGIESPGIAVFLRFPWFRSALALGFGGLVRYLVMNPSWNMTGVMPSASVRWWVLPLLLVTDLMSVGLIVLISRSKRGNDPHQSHQNDHTRRVPGNGDSHPGPSAFRCGIQWWLTGEVSPQQNAVGLGPTGPRPDQHLSQHIGRREHGPDLEGEHSSRVPHPNPQDRADQCRHQRATRGDQDPAETGKFIVSKIDEPASGKVQYELSGGKRCSDSQVAQSTAEEEPDQNVASLVEDGNKKEPSQKETQYRDQGIRNLHVVQFCTLREVPLAFWLMRFPLLCVAGYWLLLG